MQYAPHGAVKQVTLGNGVQETRVDNDRLQPWTTTVMGGGTTLLGITLGYGGEGGNNGNVTSQTVTAGGKTFTQTYLHDGKNRIESAVEGNGGLGWTQTYTIDAYGNRGMSTTMSAPQWDAPGYDAATNRLSSGTGWVYDDAGNLTNTPFAAITYDAENRQKTFTNEGNGTYFYDGAGRRVKEVWGGSTRVFVYDAFGQLAAEYGGTGASVGRRYVTGDHLGSVRLVTDGAGAVAERLDYTPYGEVIGTTGCGQPAGAGRSPRCDVAGYGSGGGGMRMKFTGKERDAETGLDFFGARYLSSAQGRFTSPDSPSYSKLSYPQTWNLYSYAVNNPLNYVDPDGHEIVCANHAEQCQRDAAAAAGNAEAAKRVSATTTTTKHSFCCAVDNFRRSNPLKVSDWPRLSNFSGGRW